MSIQRGEIYYVCFDPVFGREIGGFTMRPALVLSINDVNENTRVVTVVPGTDARHKASSLREAVTVEPSQENGLMKPTSFQCHQVRAIERGRFTQGAKGRMAREDLGKIETAVTLCLGLDLAR